MSVTEIIKGIQALPKEQRAQVIEYVRQLEEGVIPESFKQGMADVEAGRVVDMESRRPSRVGVGECTQEPVIRSSSTTHS